MAGPREQAIWGNAGITNFDGFGLDHYEMWLAHGSKQSEWPAGKGIMSVGGLAFGHYQMRLAQWSKQSKWSAVARIVVFGGLSFGSP